MTEGHKTHLQNAPWQEAQFTKFTTIIGTGTAYSVQWLSDWAM